KVKVKYCESDERGDDFAIDEVKYDGRFAARGASFSSHIAFVMRLYDVYQEKIRNLESNYSIRPVASEGNLRIDGSPITMVLNRPIRNLSQFCASLFASKEPF